MIQLIKLLNEIGEASGRKYKWKREILGDLNITGEKQVYRFITDSGLDYRVLLRNDYKFIEVDFEANDSYNVTNRGEMFSVMATIIDIIKSALENLNTGSDPNNSDVLGLKYLPSAKGGDNGSKRNKLYIAYIKKAFPNTKLMKLDMYTFVKFK